jgi:hypothetical protein
MQMESEKSDSKHDIFSDESNGLQLTKEDGGDPEQQVHTKIYISITCMSLEKKLKIKG